MPVAGHGCGQLASSTDPCDPQPAKQRWEEGKKLELSSGVGVGGREGGDRISLSPASSDG